MVNTQVTNLNMELRKTLFKSYFLWFQINNRLWIKVAEIAPVGDGVLQVPKMRGLDLCKALIDLEDNQITYRISLRYFSLNTIVSPRESTHA